MKKIILLIFLVIILICAIICLIFNLSGKPSIFSDEYDFEKFVSQMNEVQANFDKAVMLADASEKSINHIRSKEQLINYVARGGDNVLKNDEDGLKKWLTQKDAYLLPCTIINKKFAKDVLGENLPTIKVDTAKANNQEVSFFVTTKGTVFCFPPFIYNGKSYINANTTLSYSGTDATSMDITFNVDENGNEIKTSLSGTPTIMTKDMDLSNGSSIWYVNTEKTDDRGVAEGIIFEYDNTAIF